MSRNHGDRSAPLDDEPTVSRDGAPRSSSVEDEFEAGQIVAGRFRIVGRLGSGGMGDVYRADDHELGTSVALKFLPAGLAGDPVRLERLRNEVRLARQISHPNVCRVYDIGDADGRPFLSMEYIDGEDLASLLRRIGRLPGDKAVELAREICAALGAAHELGVVHRDLKPANVMIDGRGRARVADFGLAAAADDLREGRETMAGTPAYMAPEQLRGAEANRLTDIYALGLLLYELFTGKRAHDASTIAELRESDSTSASPVSPSHLVDGMDPAVERVIMHCLDADPAERPAGALEVMAALPGGDPLAAMLKAGEMPSPALVAASGRRGTLTVQRALQMGAIVVFGIAIGLWVFATPSFDDRFGGVLAPEVLQHTAEGILSDLGFDLEKADTSWSYDVDNEAIARLYQASDSDFEAIARSERRPPIRFWYRSSPLPMEPWRVSLPGLTIGGIVTPEDPPLDKDGMTLVRLGPRGSLIELRVAPGSVLQPAAASVEETFAMLTEASELDPSSAEVLAWQGVGPMPGDSTYAWKFASGEAEEDPRVLVATFAGGRLTWVRIDPPTASGADRVVQDRDPLRMVFFMFFVVGAAVAVVNIRSGRWDRRGAWRLATVSFALCFASALISSHHPFSPSEEIRGFFASVAYAATRALMTWVLYVAIEPVIRRLRPSSLVSWSRLLAGRATDPAVGRDVLVGLTVLSLQWLVPAVVLWALGERGALLPVYAFASGENPLSAASYIGAVVRLPVVTLGSALGFLLVYVVARWLLGPLQRLAPVLLWVLMFWFMSGAYRSTGQGLIPLLVFAAVSATTSAYLAVRHGLLAYATCFFISQVSMMTVPTVDPNDWFFAPTAIMLTIILSLTVFGVSTSTDRRLVTPVR